MASTSGSPSASPCQTPMRTSFFFAPREGFFHRGCEAAGIRAGQMNCSCEGPVNIYKSTTGFGEVKLAGESRHCPGCLGNIVIIRIHDDFCAFSNRQQIGRLFPAVMIPRQATGQVGKRIAPAQPLKENVRLSPASRPVFFYRRRRTAGSHSSRQILARLRKVERLRSSPPRSSAGLQLFESFK